jgi:F1F0 ATPase subunit 2
MSEIVYSILTLFTGIITGVMFYGGLWYTVQKIVSSKMPALWVIGSFLIRVGITLLVFYYISFNRWQWLPVCLVGFIIARFLVSRITKSAQKNPFTFKKEVNHAH